MCNVWNDLQENYDGMLEYYRQLLTYIKSAVTKNYAEKSINSILDYVSSSKQTGLLQQFYEITLEALKVSVTIFLELARVFKRLSWNSSQMPIILVNDELF